MSKLRRPLAGLAALTAVAALAAAAPAAARDAQTDALGTELIHTLLAPMDLKQVMIKGMESEFGDLAKNGRPEWPALMVEAANEEIDHDLPAIERLFGHALAENTSAAELREMNAFLTTEGGKALLVVIGDAAAERPMTPLSKKAEKDVEKFMRTPAGVSFQSKMQRMEKLLAPYAPDLAAELVPGLLRRFADKAEAAENARHAGAGR
ncbi:hypothetical protein [Caulobacter sp. 17J65-9]|uniref:hypothetical protein n=1 Tax=Caulobacter sp. 17J65-9 TaxID=2709382 RepID=UPI0013C93B7A|nr:hypothetical protein [Caulobacter sp. 17J65-9]NEX93884.1 hypothetical protein [Caulobacter sp. 17J65-9]